MSPLKSGSGTTRGLVKKHRSRALGNPPGRSRGSRDQICLDIWCDLPGLGDRGRSCQVNLKIKARFKTRDQKLTRMAPFTILTVAAEQMGEPGIFGPVPGFPASRRSFDFPEFLTRFLHVPSIRPVQGLQIDFFPIAGLFDDSFPDLPGYFLKNLHMAGVFLEGLPIIQHALNASVI